MAILAIDAGTTGVTALIVDEHCSIRSRGYREFPQHFPRPGWVEHSPDEIWAATLAATRDALESSDARIEAVGAVGKGVPLTVSYSGDATHDPASTTANITVTNAPVALTLTATTPSGTVGVAYTGALTGSGGTTP